MRKIFYTLLFSVVALSACTKPLGEVDVLDSSSNPPETFSIGLKQLVDNKLLLSWGKSQYAKKYTLKYGTATGVYTHTLENVTSPYPLTTLTNGQIYYFKVFAENDHGEVSTNEDSATYYKKPEIFDITSVDTQAGITTIIWTTSANATGYVVKVGTSSGNYSVGQYPISAPTTTVSFPGLTPAQNYFFRIVATNAAGNRNSTTEFTHGPEAPPSTPINFAAVTDPANRFNCKLSWDESTGAGTKTYLIKKSTTTGATPPGGAATAYQGTNLAADIAITARTYFWAKATSTHGESSWAGPVDCEAPNATVDTLSLVAGYGKITANWTGTNADTYKVEYGLAANSITTLVGEYQPDVNSLQITGLTNGTTYHVRVTAINSASTNSRTSSSAPVNTVPTITRLSSSAIQTSFQTPVDLKVRIADTENTLDCATHLIIVSSNNLIVSPSAGQYSGDATMCTIRVTPEAGSEGTVTVTARVRDDDNSVANSAFTVQVYPTATRIYSLRKRVATYSGPAVKIRRNNDGATQDFGFLDSDALNTTAINTFISGAGGATIERWYDQSGNNQHATQLNSSKQLVYNASYFAGTGTQFMEIPNLGATTSLSGIIATATQVTQTPEPIFSWSDHSGTNGVSLYSVNSGTRHFELWSSGGAWEQSVGPVHTAVSSTNSKIGFVAHGGGGAYRKLKVGTGTLVNDTSINFSSPAGGTTAYIGAGSTDVTSNFYRGRFVDVILFSNELSTTHLNMVNSF